MNRIMRNIPRKLFVLLTFALAAEILTAENARFEFVNQSMDDILFALSEYRGIPIVADSTVTGNATFRFAGAQFDSAFDTFLRVNRLYADRSKDIWTVSKILVCESNGSYSVHSFDSYIQDILDRLSALSGKTIVYETIPNARLSIHITEASLGDAVSLLLKGFQGYQAVATDTHILVSRSAERLPESPNQARLVIRRSGDSWSAEMRAAKLSDIIATLCAEEGTGYVNTLKADPVISGISLQGAGFQDVLSSVLIQGSCASFVKDGIRYFLPALSENQAEALRNRQLGWEVYRLKAIKASRATELLCARFPGVKVQHLPDGSGILMQTDSENSQAIRAFLSTIDTAVSYPLVTLNYVSTKEFLAHLPPSVMKEDICETGTGLSFFFTGPAEAYHHLLGELREIDKPKSRLRYDMLIIQYDKSSSLNWKAGVEARPLSPGDMTAVTGSFAHLLGLNFDVITLFGYQFSARLEASLAENSARVFADTTLQGISGENIQFQNTHTYRYRDSTVDPATGKPVFTGITREIVSGVTLNINGWVSGDGMVTMDIKASVSKRGADVSSASSNPPPTSEKSIVTKLNASSGEPVILSGLVQEEETAGSVRVPFLSRMPLIGLLFKTKDETKTQSETVIYIVPHITNGHDSSKESGLRAKTAYDRLVLDYEKGRER